MQKRIDYDLLAVIIIGSYFLCVVSCGVIAIFSKIAIIFFSSFML